jgi:hypothetical protein
MKRSAAAMPEARSPLQLLQVADGARPVLEPHRVLRLAVQALGRPADGLVLEVGGAAGKQRENECKYTEAHAREKL